MLSRQYRPRTRDHHYRLSVVDNHRRTLDYILLSPWQPYTGVSLTLPTFSKYTNVSTIPWANRAGQSVSVAHAARRRQRGQVVSNVLPVPRTLMSSTTMFFSSSKNPNSALYTRRNARPKASPASSPRFSRAPRLVAPSMDSVRSVETHIQHPLDLDPLGRNPAFRARCVRDAVSASSADIKVETLFGV